MRKLAAIVLLTVLVAGCGGPLPPAAPVGTALDDPQGDIEAPHADVTRFETALTEEGVLVATFTLADLPAELPRNREGVPAGAEEYAWRVNVWPDGRVSRHADYRMQAAYISTGSAFREATPLERLLERGVYKHASAGDFFRVQNAALEFDADAGTLTLRSAVPGVHAGSLVLFEVLDGVAGRDTVEPSE